METSHHDSPSATAADDADAPMAPDPSSISAIPPVAPEPTKTPAIAESFARDGLALVPETVADDGHTMVSETFSRNGYAVVRALFTPAEIDELRETFMEAAADGPVDGLSDAHWRDCDDHDPLRRHPRMMHPHRHPDKPVGPLAMRRMLDPRLRTVLESLMGEPVAAAQSMFYFKPPGARGQDLHQDNFYLRVAPGTCCAMWLAVDDSDDTNGGMRVVPGTGDLPVACPETADASRFFTSHHVAPPEGKTPVSVPLQAGDVLFFNGNVIHGSLPNTSPDRWRRAFICHYVPKASAEVSHWYECLDWDGNPVGYEDATGGGACGETVPAPKAPH